MNCLIVGATVDSRGLRFLDFSYSNANDQEKNQLCFLGCQICMNDFLNKTASRYKKLKIQRFNKFQYKKIIKQKPAWNITSKK